MPAIPFGTTDPERRARIEEKKELIRVDIYEMEELVTGWEEEARNDDVPMVVATRAMEHERNRLLDELEPLHDEVAEALTYLTSPTDSWYRGMAERVRGWVPDRRDDPIRLRNRALEIVYGLGTDLPKPHELATIRQALKLIR
jgi:hypothetical protein